MNESTIKFIKKSIVFVAILILLIILLNKLYYLIVITRHQQFRIEKDFQEIIKDNPSFDYIFLGSSHSQYADNPKYIPGSFNLAYNSNSYIEMYYKLRKVIYNDKIHIKYIILELDLSSLSSYMLGSTLPLKNDLWYYIDFVPLSEINKATKKSRLDIGIQALFPFLGKGMDFITVSSQNKSALYHGWIVVGGDFSKNDMVTVSSQRIFDQFIGKSRIDPLLLEYYLKILALAKENNISVVLIRYPASKVYDEVLTERNVAKSEYYLNVLNKTDVVLQDYSILDYYDIFFDHPEYFGDADHVNYIGSEILSKKIYTDLKNLNTNKTSH